MEAENGPLEDHFPLQTGGFPLLFPKQMCSSSHEAVRVRQGKGPQEGFIIVARLWAPAACKTIAASREEGVFANACSGLQQLQAIADVPSAKTAA